MYFFIEMQSCDVQFGSVFSCVSYLLPFNDEILVLRH